MIIILVNKNFLLFWSFLLFSGFVLFSYVVHKNTFHQFDFDMTVRLQDHLPRRVDSPFSVLSLIGSFEIAGIFLLIALAIRRKLSGIIVLGAFAFFHVFEVYGKTFVKHFPPPHFMLRTQQLANFPQFYVSAENSYPSGHAARAAFITAILWLILRKNQKLTPEIKLFIYSILVLYDLIMFTSRIYLGEHWTTDVIGGALLGLAFGLFGGIFI